MPPLQDRLPGTQLPQPRRGNPTSCTTRGLLIFLKPSTVVIGPDDKIILPRLSRRVDYEFELGIVIGRRAKDVGHCPIIEMIPRVGAGLKPAPTLGIMIAMYLGFFSRRSLLFSVDSVAINHWLIKDEELFWG